MNLLPDKQLFTNVPFQSTKYRKKEMCVDNKVRETIGDVYCPGKYCFNREKSKCIGGYVTTPRSVYGCDNCGAWLFVHKVPFTLQGHVKTTKTDKTRFLFAKKR